MKKKKRGLAVLLALLLSLSACGSSGSSGGGTNSGASTDTAPSFPMDANMSPSYADDGYANAGGWNEMPDVPEGDAQEEASTLPAGAKVILSAELSLETTEFETAQQTLSRLVQEAGGWFESRNIYQGGGYRSLRATVRVPAKAFQTFLDQAGEAAHVTNRDEYTEDISEVYYDKESRLTTQQTKLERLQLLLSRADVMEDIIALESAISETELEIEHLTGSLRKYDSLVGYSTITLSLHEVYRLSGDEEPAVTFGQRLSSAFSLGLTRGIEGMEEFAVALARNWFNLLVMAAAAAVIVLFLRWQGRKRRRSFPRPPQPPEPPQPPAPPASDE